LAIQLAFELASGPVMKLVIELFIKLSMSPS